jgi:hypothetical protein
MPTPKLQPSRALTVIPSNDANVPTPNLLIEGVATISGNQLIDASANFIITTPTGVQYKVNPGDVVYVMSIPAAATIVEVVNATTLLLNVAVGGTTENYRIYQEGAQTGLFNQGAVLYVGTGGFLAVRTSGNDFVTFTNVPSGTFIPVNVTKVIASGTDCTDIIALW